jgi:glycosyltransferase involved in cell wall biosynthesis
MPVSARVSHLEALARLEVFRIPAERNGVRARWDQARSLVMRRSETYWRYDHPGYRRRLLELVLERDPVLVHMDSVVLHGYLPLLERRTVVLSHHRPETEHLLDMARRARGPGAGYLERQARWMSDVERAWLPRVAANTVSTEDARSVLVQRAPAARVEVVPEAVDTDHYTPAEGTGHGLAFVGGTRAPANREALAFFADEVLPRLRSAGAVQVLDPISWVGGSMSGDRERYRERGIDLTDYVEDIRPIVRPAACYVVPRRKAGGRTRILQAWAMGKAVVSTTVGCQGLDAVDGQNILIRDDPDSFARAVLDVLEDRELRGRLGRAARETAVARYSWTRAGRVLVSLYRDLEGTSPLRARHPADS